MSPGTASVSALAGRAPRAADGPPVLLLCPPGSRVYQRDNYCSHESKASYYWYPYDLVVQSGILETIGRVTVLDATALHLTPAAARERVGAGPYRAVLALVGAVCWDEDVLFLRQVAEQTRSPLFVSGDVVCAHPQQALEALPFVSGVLMDYTSAGLAAHLA
jgi:anaerobic magnesium-protoporphyrin IX monomethyl ester cyclase